MTCPDLCARTKHPAMRVDSLDEKKARCEVLLQESYGGQGVGACSVSSW